MRQVITYLNRCARGLLLLGVFGAFSAAPALAAPQFDISIRNDADETQEFRVMAKAGSYRLEFGGDETTEISFNASAGVVQGALNVLPSIAAGGGSVSVSGGPGGADGKNPYRITFDSGPLAGVDVPELSVLPDALTGRARVITPEQGGISRSDRRVDYTVSLKNLSATPTPLPHSAAAVGDVLTCAGAAPPRSWSPSGAATRPLFSFAWRRNGAPIAGQAAERYTVTAADAGAVLQCLVTGTKQDGSAAAVYASLPGIVVGPPPTVDPPRPTSPTNAESRPSISGSGSAQRTCAAPTNWTAGGMPVSFSFQWLRNGEPIPGAIDSTYDPQAGVGQPDQDAILQCMAIGTNVGGSLVGVSGNSIVGDVPNAPSNTPANTPTAIANATTVTVELPGGDDNFIYTTSSQGTPATGWVCSRHGAVGGEPARVICTNYQMLGLAQDYPEFTVAAGLGDDRPPTLVAKATVVGGGAAAPESTLDEMPSLPEIPFGIIAFETRLPESEGGADFTQAGGHPHWGSAFFHFSPRRTLTSTVGQVERVRNVITDLPRGFVANALAVPELCPGLDQVRVNFPDPPECLSSAIGGIELTFGETNIAHIPLFAVEPEFGRAAQVAFAVNIIGGTTYTFAPRLRAEDGYAITVESSPVVGAPPLLAADVILCNFGAEVEYPVTLAGALFKRCKEPHEPDANPIPLITAPTRCVPPLPKVTLTVDTWENPGAFKSRDSIDPLNTGCEQVEFEPEIDLQPTSTQAGSPTGLDVELTMPTDGLIDPLGISQSMMKRVKVHFPEGMSVNASAGHGLGSCSSDQVGMNPNTGVPNDAEARCPDSSKIGTIAIETPLIQEKLTGDVFIAKQGDHPFETPVALYMVFSSKKDGITIKVAGKVETHPVTGQMTVTFDNNPEQPFSKVELHFPQGSRANLTNPPRCGAYEIKAEITPWSALDPDNPTAAETVTSYSPYHVNAGPGGGPCPKGELEPHLNAGTTNPLAGAKAPFLLRLSREDGTQRFTALNLATPPGLVADLRGIPYCPDAVLAAISPAPETGQAQIDNPSCPAASLIGSARAGAGAGPNPLYVDTGRVYLAGPYKGAPLSIAVVTPAVAGPLDLGNVVIRNAIHVDPVTARISAVSDPIPTILHGILLDVRDIRVAIDRPGFTQNPTNCEPLAVDATVAGERGASAARSNAFQVGNCRALGFKPNVTLRLLGGTKRGGHPSLRAVVRPRPGDANIKSAAVALPSSAFLDQANIRTICTRVQWANDNCPKAAIYGQATAWSPLLDVPLKGPAYLRSSDNLLPDLVVDLRGPAHLPIKIEAAFRTDSIRGGIRSTLDIAPDAPVSRFALRMQGGKRKGLIVNSRDICRGTNRATSRMNAHNGRRSNTRPKVHAANCGKARKGAKQRGGKRSNLSQLRAVR